MPTAMPSCSGWTPNRHVHPLEYQTRSFLNFPPISSGGAFCERGAFFYCISPVVGLGGKFVIAAGGGGGRARPLSGIRSRGLCEGAMGLQV